MIVGPGGASTRGCSLDAVDSVARAPLRCVSSGSDVNVVKALLEYNTNARVEDRCGARARCVPTNSRTPRGGSCSERASIRSPLASRNLILVVCRDACGIVLVFLHLPYAYL